MDYLINKYKKISSILLPIIILGFIYFSIECLLSNVSALLSISNSNVIISFYGMRHLIYSLAIISIMILIILFKKHYHLIKYDCHNLKLSNDKLQTAITSLEKDNKNLTDKVISLSQQNIELNAKVSKQKEFERKAF